jgi:FixJ family two-component response regulator
MAHGAFLYLVDGDRDSRRELAGRLATRGIETWPFDTAAGFLQLLDKLRPSCVLLDIRIDGGRGAELVAALRERGRAWPVIALDTEPDVATAVAAMRAGAVDFLRKPADHELLDRALATAWSCLSDGLETIGDREDALARVERLTRREQHVAAALLAGLSNKRAAHLLGLSVRTVEMHRGHLMTKLGVRNMAEGAVLLARAGFSGMPAIAA